MIIIPYSSISNQTTRQIQTGAAKANEVNFFTLLFTFAFAETCRSSAADISLVLCVKLIQKQTDCFQTSAVYFTWLIFNLQKSQASQ